MKNVIRLIFLVVVLMAAGGCGRGTDRIFPFGWARVGEPFDSLTEAVEWKFIDGADYGTIQRDVDMLNAMAAADSANMTKRVRAEYFDARLKMRLGQEDEAAALFGDAEARALADSGRHPYDLARIRWNVEPYYDPLDVETYDKISEDIQFFESVGDYYLAGAKCMDLGMLFTDLRDIPESMKWLDRADSLFRVGGLDDNILKNRGNRAINHRLAFRDREAEETMRAMLADGTLERDPAVMNSVLYNLYSFYGDTAALRRAYEWEGCDEGDRGVLESYLAVEFAKGGRLDSARRYLSLADEHAGAQEAPALRAAYLKYSAEVLDSLGDLAGAYGRMCEYSRLSDTINEGGKAEQVLRADVLRKIGERRVAAESERRRHTVVFMAVIMALIVAGGVAAWTAYRHVQRRKMAMMKAELDLEQSRRRVMAMQLAMEENERTVDSISSEIGRMSEAGDLAPGAAARLEAAIKTHGAVKNEQENFYTTFAEVSPDFVPRLKERWPGLSDAEVKLAVYMALGLDNKHIARLTGVRPESVKQAKWRLRKKMGGEELEIRN